MCHLISFAIFLLSGTCFGNGQEENTPVAEHNANYIFNAIHSATRQWGSSVDHNGFSFYLATILKDTRLYHGRHDPDPLLGIDWVAFEPEHALLFALPFVQSPPGGLYPGPGRSEFTDEIPSRLKSYHSLNQRPLRDPLSTSHPSGEDKKGYLITFRAPRDLRLLYIDGMSGAKSNKGTMNSQDHVLLNITENPDISYDGIRAQKLCELVREGWDSRLDGFIRMEAGFEAIICSIEDTLEENHVQEALMVPSIANIDPASTYFNEIRAASRAYDGYPDSRIVIDSDSLVTGFVYLDEIHEPDHLPQLRNVSNESRSQLRQEVTRMVLHGPMQAQRTGVTWQVIADKIVARYADALKYLLVPKVAGDADALLRELEHLIKPYVDAAARNATAETIRCANDDLPKSLSRTSISAQAVSLVAQVICNTLVSSTFELYDMQGPTLHRDLVRIDAVKRIEALVEYLRWPIWKRCRGCSYDRVCLVAMFPWGDPIDHDRPSCLNATQVLGRNCYWLDPRDPQCQ